MRLHQVAYATQAHKDSGRAVDARLSDIAGFAPPPCTRSAYASRRR